MKRHHSPISEASRQELEEYFRPPDVYQVPGPTRGQRLLAGWVRFTVGLMALAGIALLFCGCLGGLVPANKQQQQTVASVEKAQTEQTLAVTRMTKGSPAPVPVVTPPAQVTVSGTSNSVEVTYGATLEGASPAPVRLPTLAAAVPFEETVTVAGTSEAKVSDTDKGTLASKVSLPLGVSLLLAAAGILAVLYALKTARASSGAVNAAFGAADEALKRGIDRARDRAMNSVDPAEIAREQTRIATYEAERGKLQAKR